MEEVYLDMISELKRHTTHNGPIEESNILRHMLEKKQADEVADDISDVALSRMIQPVGDIRSTFTGEDLSLRGLRYMII